MTSGPSFALRTNPESARKIRPVKLRQQPPALTKMRKDRTVDAKPLPSLELLCQLLRYEPDLGAVFWKPRSVSFGDTRGVNTFNAKWAGKQALAFKDKIGRKRGSISGARVLASRVIWKMHYGVDPVGFIDHINGDASDDRIVNLRDVPPEQNSRNCKISRRNASGVLGVGWLAKSKKWRARIRSGGRYIELGLFDDLASAKAAREAAMKKFGYHENHGTR
jgi:HNH endonuclease/AP2 domain